MRSFPKPVARFRSATIVLVVGFLSACATGAPGSGSASTRNVITAEQLADMNQGSAYDAVQRLRPRWLQGRGVSSVRSGTPELAQVYLDGALVGGLQALTRISISNIREIRYLDGRDATTRFGTGHGGGAILVASGSNSG